MRNFTQKKANYFENFVLFEWIFSGMFSRLFHTSPGCCRIWHGQCWLHLSFLKNSIKRGLQNCVHFSCMCHIINLVIKALTKNFGLCITWAQGFPLYFFHSEVRRRHYLHFIGRDGYRKQLAPSPVETRWTSYFEYMTYHA